MACAVLTTAVFRKCAHRILVRRVPGATWTAEHASRAAMGLRIARVCLFAIWINMFACSAWTRTTVPRATFATTASASPLGNAGAMVTVPRAMPVRMAFVSTARHVGVTGIVRICIAAKRVAAFILPNAIVTPIALGPITSVNMVFASITIPARAWSVRRDGIAKAVPACAILVMEMMTAPRISTVSMGSAWDSSASTTGIVLPVSGASWVPACRFVRVMPIARRTTFVRTTPAFTILASA